MPQRGVIPPLRPSAQVGHDVAGLVPRGAVTILMSITRPQPITAYTAIATRSAVSKLLGKRSGVAKDALERSHSGPLVRLPARKRSYHGAEPISPESCGTVTDRALSGFDFDALLVARNHTQPRRYRTYVFELVADPAGDIIRGNGLVDRGRSLGPLGLVHLKSAVDCLRGHLNIERIDAQHVIAQLLVGAR